MKPLRILTTCLLLTGLALAQDKQPNRFVRVVGTAEVRVAPDRAVIEVGVEKQNPSATAAKQAADATARRILATLRTNGIDEKDIQTTYLSLRPQSRYENKVKIYYFVAAQSMTITVRELAKLEPLLEALVKAGGNRIDSVQYEVSDLRKYRDQARELAVKAAKEKARALAQALGQDIGRAQSIEEAQEFAYQAYNYQTTRSEESRDRVAGASLAPGQTSISASITVSFELN